MATVSFVGDLSGQTDGEAVSVVETSTAGDTLHTYSAAGADILKIWCVNTGTAAVKLTLEWGDATTTNNVELTIPPEDGPVLVVDRRVLGAGTVKAFAGTTAVLACWGEVWNAA